MADLATFNAACHDYNDQQFQAGRTLIEWPLAWGDCTPGQRNTMRDVFRNYSPELVAKLNGGEVAEVMLQHQLRGLDRLRGVAA